MNVTTTERPWPGVSLPRSTTRLASSVWRRAALSPRLGLMSGNTPCDGFGSFFTSWVVNALTWAQSIGARVTNNSNTLPEYSVITDAYNQTRAAGLIHFASTGNDYAASINYPASLASVNAVGAMTRTGARASFSNYGTGIMFSAPGQSIWTTDRTGADGYFSGDYGALDGTSFASPYAAGVAALILSRGPSLSAASVDQIMSLTCNTVGYDTTFGWGLVSAGNALRAFSGPTARLVGHWTCDEGGGTNVGDSSGNGLNGGPVRGWRHVGDRAVRRRPELRQQRRRRGDPVRPAHGYRRLIQHLILDQGPRRPARQCSAIRRGHRGDH